MAEEVFYDFEEVEWVMPMEDDVAVRNAEDDENGWNMQADKEIASEKKLLKQLSKWLFELPLVDLNVIAGAIGEERITQEWFESSIAKRTNVVWNPLLENFTKARLGVEARRVKTNTLFVRGDIPDDEVNAYALDILKAKGCASQKWDPIKEEWVNDYKLSNYRILKVSQELIFRNVMFNAVAHETRHKDIKDGLRVDGYIYRPKCIYDFEPTALEQRASPILFPMDGKRIANFFGIFFDKVKDKIHDAIQSGVEDYIFIHNPPIPKTKITVPWAKLSPMSAWTTQTKIDTVWVAQLAKRTAYLDAYRVSKNRIIASMLAKVGMSGESVGGMYTNKLGNWVGDIPFPLCWWTTGSVNLPPRAVAADHTVVFTTDSFSYANANIIINPVANRNDVPVYGARVFAIPALDYTALEVVASRLSPNKYWTIYITLGPNPLVWFVAAPQQSGVVPTDTKAMGIFISNVAKVVMNLIFRQIEGYAQNIQPVWMFQVRVAINNVKDGDKITKMPSMQLIPGALELVATKWHRVEQSSKIRVAPESVFYDLPMDKEGNV